LDVRYADDTTLITLTFEKLKLSTQKLENACQKFGLKVNAAKCKIMTAVDDQITINDERIDKVESFVFLGSTVHQIRLMISKEGLR